MPQETSNNIYNLLLDIKEAVGGIKTKVDNHGATINSISNTIKRMESKQNEEMGDYDRRLKPLEEDYKKRSTFNTEVKKKSWDIVWDWAKIGVVFAAGYLLTIIRKI